MHPRLWLAFAATLLGRSPVVRAVDLPWNFAVEATATVDAAHNQITLAWPAPSPRVEVANPRYTVYRKRVTELGNSAWGAGTAVPAGQNQFTDTVTPGVAYEYKITRNYAGSDPRFDGVGYVRSGIAVPLVDDRGTVLLVVEHGVAPQLTTDLAQLSDDLQGDGWRVVRIDDFASDAKPADLQARIRQEYGRAGANVRAVFLLGHLPIAFSGNATNPDGHVIRPLPADTFYGDVSGDWGPPTSDGQHWVYARNTTPAPLALAVGRVDFADLPKVQAASPYKSEVALLRNYLAKDHAYRTAQRVPARRALIGDGFGEYYWQGTDEPLSADAYRSFAPLFGNQITVADNFHGATNAVNWLSLLTSGSYLWAYGSGPGGASADSMAALGPGGVNSVDLVSRNAQADFYLLFGSFMVDWSRPNNLLRSALAPADYGLAALWAGRPFLYVHAMGLGETIGEAFRLSVNGSGSLYDTPVTVRPDGNTYVRGVYLALLGDPTLRLDPIPPVTNLNANSTTGAIAWTAPSGVSVQEYRVYREDPATHAYTLEATLDPGTRTYTPGAAGRHQLRAVVEQTGSGTYVDASEGVFWNAPAGDTPAPAPAPSPDPAPGTVKLGLKLLFTPPADPPGPHARHGK